VGNPITIQGITNYLSSLKCKNGKAKFYSCLRALCNWLYYDGYVDENPIKQVPQPRTQQKILPVISLSNLKLF